MVSPLHSNGQAELQRENVVSAFGDMASRPDLRPELLLKLTGKLQTTLDLNQLLDIFFTEMQQAVLVDGMVYQHAELKLRHSTGRLPPHSASYQLQTQKDYMGELVFHRSTRFREHELANIEGLLSTLVFPLRNALRYHEALLAAYRDPLTGAGNRVALDQTLNREIELTKRHQQDLSILMLDLDHFKLINDLYGHATGDEVLKAVVDSIGRCIRQTDMCFRYGGEEFLIMLSNADGAGALRIAERIRMSISDLRFATAKGSLQVTGSIGCASMTFEDDKESLLHRADKALYRAKHAGRNRVICDVDEVTVV